MIVVSCKGCGVRLRVCPAHAGKRVRCPRCKGVSRVPPDWYVRLMRPGEN